MREIFLIVLYLILQFSASAKTYLATTIEEIEKQMPSLKPGDTLMLADGVKWLTD